jgi:hypothetical protein
MLEFPGCSIPAVVETFCPFFEVLIRKLRKAMIKKEKNTQVKEEGEKNGWEMNCSSVFLLFFF